MPPNNNPPSTSMPPPNRPPVCLQYCQNGIRICRELSTDLKKEYDSRLTTKIRTLNEAISRHERSKPHITTESGFFDATTAAGAEAARRSEDEKIIAKLRREITKDLGEYNEEQVGYKVQIELWKEEMKKRGAQGGQED